MAALRPNIVVIFTDDQGYGDLSCYGSTTIHTPRLDSLAADGTKFTSFYAQVVCGPSRSALLTGRYPNRSLGWSMPASEVSIAELLRDSGYATGCIGKWDVSNRAAISERMPNAQGFDYFWGTLGANDNGKVIIHHNNDQLEETSDMAGLTRRYTDKGIEFIRASKERPFFLYIAHTMTHSIIDASPEFKGKSRGGLFGDTVEELDFHCGRLLDCIDQEGLRDNTLVLFTTDNGPWSNMRDELEKKHSGQIAWGSSGPLREAKGSTYEGGIRVPCLARWPGKIPAGRTSSAIFATIDFAPTFAALAGCELPKDRFIDGVNQTDLLLGKNDSGARSDYFYFCRNELHAVRRNDFKLVLADRRQHYSYVKDKGSRDVELYNLASDIGESRNLAAERPDVVKDLLRYATSIPFPDTAPDDRIGLNANVPASRQSGPGALKSGDWESHGFTSEGREGIRRAFEQGIRSNTIPGGNLLIIHKGEVVLREAFGVTDLESKEPFLVETPCRIASVTKPHTATLMALLSDKGLIDLDAQIDRYLPEFASIRTKGSQAAERAPTIRECLSHTAGFPGNDARNSVPQLFQVQTLGQAVDLLATQELVTTPGTRYDYSGFGYMVAGRTAEVVTGRTFQDLMRRHILEPIGAETATFVPDDDLKVRIPTQYTRTQGTLVPRRAENMPSIVNPGGSLISTLDDVARLMLLHRNRGKVGDHQLISEATLKQMLIAQPATKGDGYGLGFNILATRPDGSTSRIQHSGASGTLAWLDFDHDMIIVILTQVEQTKITQWRRQLLQAIATACRAE